MRKLLLLVLLVPPAWAQFGGGKKGAVRATGTAMPTALTQSGTNSHYFVNASGKAVYLVGSHTWNDFQDIGQNGSPQTFDFNGFVQFLHQHGMNATFLWRKDLPVECNWQGFTWTQSPQPYARSAMTGASDGGNKFDLTQFNQAILIACANASKRWGITASTSSWKCSMATTFLRPGAGTLHRAAMPIHTPRQTT